VAQKKDRETLRYAAFVTKVLLQSAAFARSHAAPDAIGSL